MALTVYSRSQPSNRPIPAPVLNTAIDSMTARPASGSTLSLTAYGILVPAILSWLVTTVLNFFGTEKGSILGWILLFVVILARADKQKKFWWGRVFGDTNAGLALTVLAISLIITGDECTCGSSDHQSQLMLNTSLIGLGVSLSYMN